jgi:hypothetical protein
MGIFKSKNSNNLNDEIFNVVQSISKAKVLYKNLILQSHPDKHPENIALATELAYLININRYNYRELLLLEERVKTELLKI